MKPRYPKDITTSISQRFPFLSEEFVKAQLNPDQVFVWYSSDDGCSEAILVIDGNMFEADATGLGVDGLRSVILTALVKYKTSTAIIET